MITRRQQCEARDWAWRIAKQAGLVLRDEEIERIEVADFGLSRLPQIGAQILTLEANPWVAVKILILMPWQLEPQHRHPPCAYEQYPGKTEVLRGQWGELYHYEEGAAVAAAKARPPEDCRSYLTAWKETVLRPADQIALSPNTWHWFQAGPEGAVVWTISSKATDAVDQWTDPRIARQTQLLD